MYQKVKCDIKTFDSYIVITPQDGIIDNSIYEIKLYRIKQANGPSELSNQKVVVYTKITPSYTTIEAVRSLLYNCDIPDSVILYHIREASKFVEYVTNKKYDHAAVPFNVFEYVKYKAAYDSLLSYAVNNAATGITEGTMGDVSYKKGTSIGDLSDLLKALKRDLDTWYDSLFGHVRRGPAKPAVTVKASYVQPLVLRNDDPPVRSYYK